MDGYQQFRSVLLAIVFIVVVGLGLYMVYTQGQSVQVIQWTVIILVVALAVGGSVYSIWESKKRREVLQQTAIELDLDFQPEDKNFNDQLTQITSLDLFTKGHARKAYNFLRGRRRDLDVAMFDYKYTTGGGRSSRVHVQTIALLSLEKPELIRFKLRPQGFLDKVAARLGQVDINFEHRPEFSRRYRLKGEDEASVRRLFNESVLGFFEQRRRLSCEVVGDRLLFYRAEQRVRPELLREFLEDAVNLAELLRRPSLDVEYYDFGIPKK